MLTFLYDYQLIVLNMNSEEANNRKNLNIYKNHLLSVDLTLAFSKNIQLKKINKI